MPMKSQSAPLNVYVIECPSSDDIYNERSEGKALCEVLHQAGIRAKMRSVTSADHFTEALAEYIEICAGFPKGMMRPTLHISAHGNTEGLAIGNDPNVGTWAWLHSQLVPINQAIGGELEVCISACEGFNALRMATIPSVAKPLPFNVMMGPNYKPTWGEALIGFSAFYLRLIVDQDAHTALAAIRAATGKKDWYCLKGEMAHDMFIDGVRKIDPSAADSIAAARPPRA